MNITAFTWMLLLLVFLTGCSQQETPQATWQTFEARDQGEPLDRAPLYRAKVPAEWIRKDPTQDESIADTMKPISEFLIDGDVRLTIHTFPITDQRIPPQAQINRWKSQFNLLDPLMTSTTPQFHDGFIGLFFEAEGQIQGKDTMMLGWSMNLANEYETKLRSSSHPLDLKKRADYTIKVVGPSLKVAKSRKAILLFANSFELIDELPAPL